MDTTTAARPTADEVLERFLAGYWTRRTRDNYRFIIRWLEWCHKHGYDPVGGANAAALEAFIAELNTRVRAQHHRWTVSRPPRRSTAGVCGSSWSFATP